MRARRCLGPLALLTACVQAGLGAGAPHPASLYRSHGEPVVPAAEGFLLCEAEEFAVEAPGWVAKPWGENAYAATFANTFLSRKAFLGAAATGPTARARIAIAVKDAGRYLVLVRYEAAYRFETRFRVQIEQAGKRIFDRVYGARDNTKVWAFGERLQKEVAWGWGAVENVVWEGHDAFVELTAGPATVFLVAEPQPGDAAPRNVDLALLTRDIEGVRRRIETEGYLPLDGLLTQSGDVWLRATNPGPAPVTLSSLRLYGGPFQQHSPYWVHQRNWKPLRVTLEPGTTSGWIEVGSTMDSLNDGQWGFETSGPCRIELGVRTATLQIETVRTFALDGKLPLVGLADSRYSRRVPLPDELAEALLAPLRALRPPGRLPKRTPVYGTTALPELAQLLALSPISGEGTGLHAYVDWRGKSPAELETLCQGLDAKRRAEIAVVSLGDEIGLASGGPVDAAAFDAYLRSQGVEPSEVPAAGPPRHYWSERFRHAEGLRLVKQHTDVLRRYLPNAGIGANFSPHGGPERAYLGEVFQWVSCFREDCMTLPWSEDYAWQIPVATPQMSEISLDLLRAGTRGKPEERLLFYVMPHTPGNTPRMWRRMFHAALAHGMRAVDLFEVNPVWAAYTENHTSDPEMYAEIRRTLHQLGAYEDLVHAGRLEPAQTGLWFSETSDIWRDNGGSFGAAKRTLYLTVRHAQVPLDVVVEADAGDRTLASYRVLYLTDRHVSRTAARAIVAWVRDGGTLVATAAAGSRDEYDRANDTMRPLLPVDVTLEAPPEAQIGFEKQDLPFARPLETVSGAAGSFPVFGAIARVPADGSLVNGAFSDSSPAILERRVGRGRVVYLAFLPGLSYFSPALPRRPVDRGTRDAAMAHFLPTRFDEAVGRVVTGPLQDLRRTVSTSQRNVEATVIRSPAGLLVPLINWSSEPVNALQVTLAALPEGLRASRASGGGVRLARDEAGATVSIERLDAADVIVLR
jgi:hypothetical protein